MRLRPALKFATLSAALGAASVAAMALLALANRLLPYDVANPYGARQLVYGLSAYPLLWASRAAPDPGSRAVLRAEALFAFRETRDPYFGTEELAALELSEPEGANEVWRTLEETHEKAGRDLLGNTAWTRRDRWGPRTRDCEADRGDIYPAIDDLVFETHWHIDGRADALMARAPNLPPLASLSLSHRVQGLALLVDAQTRVRPAGAKDAPGRSRAALLKLAAKCFRVSAAMAPGREPADAPAELCEALERSGLDGALARCPADLLVTHVALMRGEEARTLGEDRIAAAALARVDAAIAAEHKDLAACDARSDHLTALKARCALFAGDWANAAKWFGEVPAAALSPAHRSLGEAQARLDGLNPAGALRALAAVPEPLASGFNARLVKARASRSRALLDQLSASLPALPDIDIMPAGGQPPERTPPPPPQLPGPLTALAEAYLELGGEASDSARPLLLRAYFAAPLSKRVRNALRRFYLSRGDEENAAALVSPRRAGSPARAKASGVQGEALADYRDPARPPRASPRRAGSPPRARASVGPGRSPGSMRIRSPASGEPLPLTGGPRAP